MKILANDGIDVLGKQLLEDAGFQVDTVHLSAEELLTRLNEYDALLVRSATQVHAALIDAAPNLKLIGRGGVGMDNIEVKYARAKGIHVCNTPAASSRSVAELVFAHLFSGVRFLYETQRAMPTRGAEEFLSIKKSCAQGTELKGKTLGIIGFGRIGKEVARMGLGLGMHIISYDATHVDDKITLSFSGGITVDLPVRNVSFEVLLQESDFITLHVPFTEMPLLDERALSLTKPGVGIINAARGGVVDEEALLASLDAGHVSFAGLDVFDNEPKPNPKLLVHPRVSLSPHIGATTLEAQQRVGQELADQVINFLQREN
jgi:D-3-phosphoglycerate dehydrogenase